LGEAIVGKTAHRFGLQAQKVFESVALTFRSDESDSFG
jgi:hypothetical protein